MHSRILENIGGRRKFVVVLAPGEEAIATIQDFASEHRIGAASITGIGAFSGSKLGFFNPATKVYKENVLEMQTEVLSLLGNVSMEGEGNYHLHIHVVLGCDDASTRGGHLVSAWVNPTLELIIEESPGHLNRGKDEATGLVLLQP